MARAFLYMMMAALLTACGHRASQQHTENAEQADSVATADVAVFATDSIALNREDSMAIVKVCIDWPVSGDSALVSSIRQYISEELAFNPTQEGKPKVILYTDGQKAVSETLNKHYKSLRKDWLEMAAEGMRDMTFEFALHTYVLENSDRYITYISHQEGYTGGAHGYALSAGQTFRKSDGLRIGYQTEYNRQAETFEVKNQTLFKNPQSPQLLALIKEGVRSYFRENGEEALDDEQLKDLLIGVEDINRIPLPSGAPYFTKKGLAFVYQQYEIAPYAAGLVNFDISYDKIRPFLTDKALELLK